MINTSFAKSRGHLCIELKNSAGDVIDYRECSNIIVTTGKNWITGRLKDTGGTHTVPNKMSHMAIGTSTHVGWPDESLATLKNESIRKQLDSTEVVGNTITYTATFSQGEGVGSIVEAGIFNANTGGDMLCRTEFAVINKGSGDTMTISWVVTLV